MATPFHIYLDLEVRNDDTVTAGRAPPPLSFEETRTQPFLDGDASEYFCTIARFTLQTGNSLPLFIPIIDTTQVPPPPGLVPTYAPQNKTIYAITLWEQPNPSDPTAARICLTQPVLYEPHHLTWFPRTRHRTRPSTRSLCGSSPTHLTPRLHASVSRSLRSMNPTTEPSRCPARPTEGRT